MGSEYLMTLRYHHYYGAHFPCGVTYDESKPLAHRFPHELQEPKFDRGDTDFTAGLNHQTFRTYPTTKLLRLLNKPMLLWVDFGPSR